MKSNNIQNWMGKITVIDSCVDCLTENWTRKILKNENIFSFLRMKLKIINLPKNVSYYSIVDLDLSAFVGAILITSCEPLSALKRIYKKK